MTNHEKIVCKPPLIQEFTCICDICGDKFTAKASHAKYCKKASCKKAVNDKNNETRKNKSQTHEQRVSLREADLAENTRTNTKYLSMSFGGGC